MSDAISLPGILVYHIGLVLSLESTFFAGLPTKAQRTEVRTTGLTFLTFVIFVSFVVASLA